MVQNFLQLLLVFWYRNPPLGHTVPPPSLVGHPIPTAGSCRSPTRPPVFLICMFSQLPYPCQQLLATVKINPAALAGSLELHSPNFNLANKFLQTFQARLDEDLQNTCIPFVVGLHGRRRVFVRKPSQLDYDYNSEGAPNSFERLFEVPRVSNDSGRGSLQKTRNLTPRPKIWIFVLRSPSGYFADFRRGW